MTVQTVRWPLLYDVTVRWPFLFILKPVDDRSNRSMTVPFESGPFVLSVNRSVPLTGPFVLARNRSVNRTGPVRSGPFVRTGGQKPTILSGHQPKTKELLELLFFSICLISSLKGILASIALLDLSENIYLSLKHWCRCVIYFQKPRRRPRASPGSSFLIYS